MRNLITHVTRVLGILCILAGIALWCVGCSTDAQGNSRLFGMAIGADGSSHFSADQAAKDARDPQMQAQANLLGPWGAPGLEALGAVMLFVSHLNHKNTVKALAGSAPVMPGTLTTPPIPPAAPAPQV